jgi:hypothetical protein
VSYPVAQAKKAARYSITHRHRCHHDLLRMTVPLSDDYIDDILIHFVAMDVLRIGVAGRCRGRRASATFRYRLVQPGLPSPFWDAHVVDKHDHRCDGFSGGGVDSHSQTVVQSWHDGTGLVSDLPRRPEKPCTLGQHPPPVLHGRADFSETVTQLGQCQNVWIRAG